MIPRALRSPVFGMARPARPEVERRTVMDAAEVVMAETGLTSAKSIAGEIAKRVVGEMLADLERDDLTAALAALEHRFSPSPFYSLATCPEIDTNADFVQSRVDRLRARSGRSLANRAQQTEIIEVAHELAHKLTTRYGRQLLASGEAHFIRRKRRVEP